MRMRPTTFAMLLALAGGIAVFGVSARMTVPGQGGNPELFSFKRREPARLLFTGDVMLGRNIQTRMAESGSDYPFAKIRDHFSEDITVIANLEGPIFENAPHTPINSLSFSFPPAGADALDSAGFDIVSLANNHTYDQGALRFEETKAILRSRGIDAFGHPLTEDAGEIIQKEIAGRKFVLIGFNATYPSFDTASAVKRIAERRADGDVIVSIHWGAEYESASNQTQRDIAHALIDAGADLVIGHHPHVIQELEIYKNKLVAYSLGNFVFDQYFSKETQEGLMISAEITDSEIKYVLIPVAIELGQPRVMDGEQKETLLAGLAARSPEPLRDGMVRGEITLEN